MKAQRPLMALSALAALVVAVGAQTYPAAGSVLRFGFVSSMIDDVNTTDALAAMTVWVKAVGKATGAYSDARANAFDDLRSLLKALDTTDLVALSTADFLSIEQTLPAEPCMAYKAYGEILNEYVLIARTGSASLASLRGQRLLVHNPASERTLADMWLDVLLSEAGLPDRARFWTTTSNVKKASQAILPIFFKQADVGLVRRSAFETAVDLNPQLGRELVVMAKSPALLPGVICACKGMAPDLRRRSVEAATTIHENAAFKQTFMVLRMNQLLPWDPHYLDAARVLYRKYEALVRRTAGRQLFPS